MRHFAKRNTAATCHVLCGCFLIAGVSQAASAQESSPILTLSQESAQSSQLFGKDALAAGYKAYDKRSFQTAERLFRKALTSPQNEAEARLMLGRTLTYLKRYEEAQKEVNKALSLGLTGDKQREAQLTLRFIEEAVAAKGDAPGDVDFFVGGLMKAEMVNGVARYTGDQAQDQGPNFDYDPVRQTDWRMRVGANIGATVPIGATGGKLTGEYMVGQTLHHEVSEADVGSHSARLHYYHPLGNAAVAEVQYNTLLYTIDDQELYSLTNQLSASTTFRQYRSSANGITLLGKVGINGGYSDYFEAEAFDGWFMSGLLSQQLRFRNPDDRVTVSYSGGRFFSDEERYRYLFHRALVTGQVSFNALGLLRGKLSYTHRDFDGYDTIHTTKSRFDNVYSAGAGYSYPVTTFADLELDYTYSNHDSNIARSDYETQVLSIGAKVNF